MLHACFVSTILCFVYTLRHFYTFSGTNLLIRCRIASCLFSAVFGFTKASQEIFYELDETKAEIPIFQEDEGGQKEEWRWATGGPHHPLERVPLAAPPGGVATLAHL